MPRAEKQKDIHMAAINKTLQLKCQLACYLHEVNTAVSRRNLSVLKRTGASSCFTQNKPEMKIPNVQVIIAIFISYI